MSRRNIFLLKVAVWAACLWPLARLAYEATSGNLEPDPVATVTHATGYAALRILIISLAITPVRRLSQKLSWIIRFRRLLGLFAFFYACLHLVTYVWLFAGLDVQTMIGDITKRRYIIVGMAAWLLLVPLALTSTQRSIRALGGKRWQMLHRLVYLSAVGGILHYWWIVKKGVLTPLPLTLALAGLLLARPLWSALQARKRQTVQA